MKIRNIFLAILIATLTSVNVFAQQIANYRSVPMSLYMWNPSSISMSDMPDVILNNKFQWAGFTGAPNTVTLGAKYSFRPDMSAGLGLMLDSYGIQQKIHCNLDYSYRLHTEYFDINMGLAWTFTQFRLSSSDILIYNTNDDLIDHNLDYRFWRPDANIGFLLENKDFYAGASVMQVLKTKFIFGKSVDDMQYMLRNQRHYMLMGAYKFNLQGKHRIMPFTNIYFAKATPWTFDLGVQYTYNQMFLTGLNFSKGDAVTVTLGYTYNKKYNISYSFDILVSKLMTVTSSHEITISAFLFDKNTKPKYQ